ncbi:MAG: hypothetical protein KA914_11070 [Ottowia sp.]|nr:hypothetical protein [Ottowia sp.]
MLLMLGTSGLVGCVLLGCAAGSLDYNTPRQQELDRIEQQWVEKRAERAQLQAALQRSSGSDTRGLEEQLALVEAEVVRLARALDIPVSAPYTPVVQPAVQPVAPTVPAVPTEKLDEFVTATKTNLVRDFKDPEGARFRDTFVGSRRGSVLCGEVNAKNSYGAYTGYRRFYATTSPAFKFIESEHNATTFAVNWKTYCQR